MGVSLIRERCVIGGCPRCSARTPALLKLTCAILLALIVLIIPVRVTTAAESVTFTRSIEFGGGAIVDFVPAGEDEVLVLGAMPDGFSVFSLDFAGGAVTKLVSHTYLSRLTGEDANASSFSLNLDPASGLLILLSDSRNVTPVALNVSAAPYLTRYKLGIPEDFLADGVAFHQGSAYFYSHIVSGAGGITPLIVFNPKQQELSELVPDRKFAIIRAVLPTAEEKRLLVCGFFRPQAQLSTYELAWLDLDTGKVSVIPGSGRTIIAAAAGNRLALVRRAVSHVAMGDEPAPTCRLEILEMGESLDTIGHSIPLYSNPEWLGLSSGGEWVIVLTTSDGVRRSLWLISTLTRAKELVRKEVLAVQMSPSGRSFFVLPADTNAVERYSFIGEGQ